MKSIIKYLYESTDIESCIPKKDLNNIIQALTKLSYEQASSWPKFDRRSQNFKLYPFEPVLLIKGKKTDKITKDSYYRVSGYIEIGDGHSSDVVAFYYPKTGKYTIESNGING